MLIEMLGDEKTRPYFFAVVITVIVSITIHELAHGVAAVWLGDRTPIETGHMTLNPAVHLGPFSVIALLLAGIAWGAMPVNPDRMRGRHGDAWVSLAGPFSNAVLALLSLGALALWWKHAGPIEQGTPAGNGQFFLEVFGTTNIVLALFNLIPLPPLDGSRILQSFSAGFRRLVENLGNSGASMIVFLILFSTAGNFLWPLAQRISLEWIRVILRA
jgi:Zn-dependent protease